MTLVEMGTHLATERAGLVTLHLTDGAPDFYPSDGEPVIITLHQDNNGWTPKAVVRIAVTYGHIIHIADYAHCTWVLPAATSVIVAESFPN